VACAGLLAPEIVNLSRVARVGFVAFGTFVAVLSSIFVLSWIPELIALGTVLVPTGAYMVAFGMRIWIFRPDDLSREQELV